METAGDIPATRASVLLQNISLERLMQALVSFDQQVKIVAQPAHRAKAPGITVAA